MQDDVDGKHHQDQGHHHLGQHAAELPDAALEIGFRGAQGQLLGDLAEFRPHPGFADEDAGAAAADVGAHEHAVRPLGQAGAFGDRPGFLLHRKSLAGQNRLVDEEIIGLDHDPVGRDEAPRREQHDIPRHDLFGQDDSRFPVAQKVDSQSHPAAQLLDRVAGPILLDKAQHGAGDDDGEDDAGVDPFPGHQRDDGRKNQDEDERAFKLAEKKQPGRRFLAALQHVGAGCGQTLPRLRAAQSQPRAPQRGQKLIDGPAPVGRSRRVVWFTRKFPSTPLGRRLELQRLDGVRPDLESHGPARHRQRLALELDDVGRLRPGPSQAASQADLGRLAFDVVTAQDDAVVVLGLLDRAEQHVVGREGRRSFRSREAPRSPRPP